MNVTHQFFLLEMILLASISCLSSQPLSDWRRSGYLSHAFSKHPLSLVARARRSSCQDPAVVRAGQAASTNTGCLLRTIKAYASARTRHFGGASQDAVGRRCSWTGAVASSNSASQCSRWPRAPNASGARGCPPLRPAHRAPGIGGFAGMAPVQRRTVKPPPFPSVM